MALESLAQVDEDLVAVEKTPQRFARSASVAATNTCKFILQTCVPTL
jgi:hypothetical protein